MGLTAPLTELYAGAASSMGRHGSALGTPRSDGGLPIQVPGTCHFDEEDAISPQGETLV